MSPVGTWLVDLLGVALVACGLGSCAVAVLGLFRMPDVYTRMQAAASAVAVGAAMTLFGAAVLAGSGLWLKVVGTVLFLWLTTPVATFAVARAAHRMRVEQAPATRVDELERDERGHAGGDRPGPA